MKTIITVESYNGLKVSLLINWGRCLSVSESTQAIFTEKIEHNRTKQKGGSYWPSVHQSEALGDSRSYR